MEVIVYTRPDCESSRRIKEILENRGVAFQEHICADGKLDGKDLRNLDIEVPLTVIDGVPIAGLQQAKIEQAIGWIGF
jgi:glutaredoxin